MTPDSANTAPADPAAAAAAAAAPLPESEAGSLHELVLKSLDDD